MELCDLKIYIKRAKELEIAIYKERKLMNAHNALIDE